MKIVCAWCQKDLGEKDGGGKEGISHGICTECKDKLQYKSNNLERRKNHERRTGGI